MTNIPAIASYLKLPVLHEGKARKLYLYYNFHGTLGWFPDAESFKKQTGSTAAVRVNHQNYPPPAGYRKTDNGSGLAHDPVEAIPTMKDFVDKLTPKRKK